MGKVKEILIDTMNETKGLSEEQLKSVVASKNLKIVAIKDITESVVTDLETLISNVENKGDAEEFRRILDELKQIKKF